jgi:hypothetical protein
MASYISKTPRPLARFAKAYFWVGVIVAVVGIVSVICVEPDKKTNELLVFAYKMGYCGGFSMFLASPLDLIVTRYFRIYHVIGFALGAIIAFLLTAPTLDLIERLNEETFWMLFIPPVIAWLITRKRDKFARGIRSRY